MATPQSSFVIKRLEGFGGNFIDTPHLASSYEMGSPEMLETMVTTIFSSKSSLYNPKLLQAMTAGKARGVKEISTDVYRWGLQGAEERLAISLENLESANTTTGINGSLIRIKLDVDYYRPGDVLFGEDNQYPLQIVDGPIPDGIGSIYTARIQGDNPAVFAPSSMFDQGKEFNKVWTSVANEYNEQFGTQQFASTFLLEAQTSAFAQKLTVTDKAWREDNRLKVSFSYTVDGKMKTTNRLLLVAEAKMWDELTLYSSLAA